MTDPVIDDYDYQVELIIDERNRFEMALREIDRWIGRYKVECGPETTAAIRAVLYRTLNPAIPLYYDKEN